MSKSNTFENQLLLLLFNNTALALIGDASGLQPSATAGSLYVSLHTDDPGEAGDQSTNEISYTGYARVAVARSSGGWTVSGNQVSNTAQVQFGQMTAGTGGETRYIGIGTSSSGAGKLLYRFPIGQAVAAKDFTATTADTLTVPGHSLAVNDAVVCHATPTATLPTGITEGARYYVKTVSGNDITLSTTQGGATLDITAAGAGVISKLVPINVVVGIQPQFSSGQLIAQED